MCLSTIEAQLTQWWNQEGGPTTVLDTELGLEQESTTYCYMVRVQHWHCNSLLVYRDLCVDRVLAPVLL